MRNMIISLTGFMGCGKSSVGRELASLSGAEFVDLDEKIAAYAGRTIPEIFRDGEPAFRAVELEVLDSVISGSGSCNMVIALGGGALTMPEARELVFSKTRCVYLRTRLETIRKRLGTEDASRPMFKDAEELFIRRAPVYERAALIVDTDDKTPAEVAALIAREIGVQHSNKPSCADLSRPYKNNTK